MYFQSTFGLGLSDMFNMNDLTRGRISADNIEMVKAASPIDNIISEYVTLRNAGGGSFKGLCPFHDEKSPSFNVTPSRGLWYCFGCGEGGDVIEFVQRVDHLTFGEAVEKLASKANVVIEKVELDPGVAQAHSQRLRLMEANIQAARFYRSHLVGSEASIARSFLEERGFNDEALETFMVGYAPKGWSGLTEYLRGLRFTDDEIVTAGLAVEGNRGLYDRFRGRAMWPIFDLGGQVIGFGARKLYDDDDGPKYLNTPETPLYKKSQVLYGINLARKSISKLQQAVVVEGYTDVMACHLAGVENTVASCGTAFGEGHIQILRRLLLDNSSGTSEVIFTFDGDAAGQKAAMRTFENDQRFLSRTTVAIAKGGMDPCEVRLSEGDVGVRKLLDTRIPLFQFVIKTILSRYDLNTAEGRVSALKETVPVVAKIKDSTLRPEYARLLAGWIGLNPDEVTHNVNLAARNNVKEQQLQPEKEELSHVGPSFVVQREALKIALQDPSSVKLWYEQVEESSFTHPEALAVHEVLVNVEHFGVSINGISWTDRVIQACGDEQTANAVRKLTVEPLTTSSGDGYGASVIARLLELATVREIEDLKSEMSRADAQGNTDLSVKTLRTILSLESYRRELQVTSLGV